MKEFIDCIQSIKPLSPKSMRALIAICSEVSIKKNAVLQHIESPCLTIYFINKGALRIFYKKEHTEITDSLHFENSFVARVKSLVTGHPSRKGIMAIEDTTLIAIDANKLNALYAPYRDIEQLFTQIFLDSFINVLNRIDSLQFHSAELRYSNFMEEYPDVLKRVQLKYIASYLGITQVSLSRIRARY